MTRTAIITGTDASIPHRLSEKLSIQQVPILVQFGEDCFRALYDIDDTKTFSLIDASGKLPTTSAPLRGSSPRSSKAHLIKVLTPSSVLW